MARYGRALSATMKQAKALRGLDREHKFWRLATAYQAKEDCSMAVALSATARAHPQEHRDFLANARDRQKQATKLENGERANVAEVRRLEMVAATAVAKQDLTARRNAEEALGKFQEAVRLGGGAQALAGGKAGKAAGLTGSPSPATTIAFLRDEICTLRKGLVEAKQRNADLVAAAAGDDAVGGRGEGGSAGASLGGNPPLGRFKKMCRGLAGS